jgi:hypothetical protein
LLVREPETGVAYPSEESKKTKNSWAAWAFELQNSFMTFYTTVVFILSFWL